MLVRVEHLREGWIGRPKDKNLSRAAGHPHVCRSLSTGGRFSHLSPHTCRLSCCHWPCMAPGTWLGGSSQQPTWPAPREGSPGPVGQHPPQTGPPEGHRAEGRPPLEGSVRTWQASCWGQGVGQGHADLCHPVPLQQSVACDVFPLLQHRQG